jgi:broad specificity phosphatase PhoE
MTHWNSEQRLQGWLDSPLTAAAEQQLASLRWPVLHAPRIYCSDLGRAMTSAAIVAEHIGCEVTSDPRMRERYFGPLEGQVIDEIECLGAHWAAYHNRYAKPIPTAFGIEAEAEFEARICDFWHAIKPQTQQSDVILVGHGEWLRAFINLFSGRSAWQLGEGVAENGVPLMLSDLRTFTTA